MLYRIQALEKHRSINSLEKIINKDNNNTYKESSISPKHVDRYHYINSIKKKVHLPENLKNMKYDDKSINNQYEINNSINYQHNAHNVIPKYEELAKRKLIQRNILTGKDKKDNMKEREKELQASKNKIIERIKSGKPVISKAINTNQNQLNSKERELQRIQQRCLIENYLSNGNSKKFQNIPTINISKDGLLVANKLRIVSANPELNKNKYDL